MKHHNSNMVRYLQTALIWGLTVDYRGFPPSNSGLVRQMQRKGLLQKTRETRTTHRTRISVMKITELGKAWLRRNKPPMLVSVCSQAEYNDLLKGAA